MFVFEAQVFQLGLYLIEPLTVGQRSVNIERFTRNLILLVGQHRTECAHIVQTVGYLDKDNPDIIRHGKQ